MPGIRKCFQKLLKALCLLSAQLILLTSEFYRVGETIKTQTYVQGDLRHKSSSQYRLDLWGVGGE